MSPKHSSTESLGGIQGQIISASWSAHTCPKLLRRKELNFRVSQRVCQIVNTAANKTVLFFTNASFPLLYKQHIRWTLALMMTLTLPPLLNQKPSHKSNILSKKKQELNNSKFLGTFQWTTTLQRWFQTFSPLQFYAERIFVSVIATALSGCGNSKRMGKNAAVVAQWKSILKIP